jgi:hypothetical protein
MIPRHIAQAGSIYGRTGIRVSQLFERSSICLQLSTSEERHPFLQLRTKLTDGWVKKKLHSTRIPAKFALELNRGAVVISNRVPEKFFGNGPKYRRSTKKGTTAETVSMTSALVVGLPGLKLGKVSDFRKGFRTCSLKQSRPEEVNNLQTVIRLVKPPEERRMERYFADQRRNSALVGNPGFSPGQPVDYYLTIRLFPPSLQIPTRDFLYFKNLETRVYR